MGVMTPLSVADRAHLSNTCALLPNPNSCQPLFILSTMCNNMSQNSTYNLYTKVIFGCIPLQRLTDLCVLHPVEGQEYARAPSSIGTSIKSRARVNPSSLADVKPAPVQINSNLKSCATKRAMAPTKSLNCIDQSVLYLPISLMYLS